MNIFKPTNEPMFLVVYVKYINELDALVPYSVSA
jgi:hypothetical protein